MSTCWAITEGEYSDYRILAVFSSEQAAREQLAAWGGDEVEELPFDDFIPKPPAGMNPYVVCRWDGKLDANLTYAKHLRNYGTTDVFKGCRTYLWAKDTSHAIKIAAERFAKYDAIKAGIA